MAWWSEDVVVVVVRIVVGTLVFSFLVAWFGVGSLRVRGFDYRGKSA